MLMSPFISLAESALSASVLSLSVSRSNASAVSLAPVSAAGGSSDTLDELDLSAASVLWLMKCTSRVQSR